MGFEIDFSVAPQVHLAFEKRRLSDEKSIYEIGTKTVSEPMSKANKSAAEKKQNPEEGSSWGKVLKNRQNFNEMHIC